MKNIINTPDIVLVGGGIMSATLAMFLQLLDPDLQIHIIERRESLGAESSDALNNAGTGHSALCELHYTPRIDGNIDTSKTDKIIEKFEVSKQFWAYLVQQGYMQNSFINRVPHMSLVFGDKDVAFLKERYELMKKNHLFSDTVYSEDVQQLEKRFPLMIQGRDANQPIAATRNELGTDVNFGELTRGIFRYLKTQSNIHIRLQHEVTNLSQLTDGQRELDVTDLTEKNKTKISAKKVFLGSGGMAIPLLKKSGIPQGNLYGGFPVDGQRLICDDSDIVDQHHGKVYGQPPVGAPPMSVPHLDTRIVDGRRTLLFGPFAGFTTKFLRQGHRYDLFASLHIRNIRPMLQVAFKNWSLTKYLITEVFKTKAGRIQALREYYPNAHIDDRSIKKAGKRVQIIKNDPEKGGILQFGTEVVVSDDYSLSALLGASPGASTSVSIMLELLDKQFPDKMQSSARKNKLKEIIPSYGQLLRENTDLAKKIRTHTSTVLGLSKEGFEEKVGN